MQIKVFAGGPQDANTFIFFKSIDKNWNRT